MTCTTSKRSMMSVVATVAVAMIVSSPSECMAFTTGRAPVGVVTMNKLDRSRFLNSGSPREHVVSRSSQISNLKMSAAPVAGISALAGVLSGGLMAGGLHAIAGPDHLAALIPKCCGQKWWRAGRVGALWGIGHSISATVLGAAGFFLKSRIESASNAKFILNGASTALEICVGASLIFIGFLGVKEAKEWESDIEGVIPQSLSAAAAEPGPAFAEKRSVIFNGLLHGFSWDGAPSLLPALAVTTWTKSLTFLLSYGLGTIVVMTGATTLIGEATRRAGELFDRPDIPQKISLISSFVAMLIGAIWIGLALV